MGFRPAGSGNVSGNNEFKPAAAAAEDDDAGQSVTSSLTRSDAGLYTCVVKNIAGHVSHNISLFIEGLSRR